jgi:sugar-specific transcriptional regulator TrmB
MTCVVGSGKSTLMSLVVDELLEESQIDRQKLVAFFFCDKTSRNEQLLGPRSILRSLLKQLVSMKGEIPEDLNKAYESERRNGIINRRAHSFLQTVIESARETKIVIDGLDECDIETRTELLDDLKWLEKAAFRKVRIIVASRPDSGISHFFEENYPSATITIRSDRDIELFVRKKVEEEFRLKRFSSTLRPSEEQIITTLISRSEGMYVLQLISVFNYCKLTCHLQGSDGCSCL